MFPDGSYVLNVMSPVPLLGTVTKGQLKDGQQEYWFTPDSRISAGFRETFSVTELDLELYSRPTRDEIQEINRLLANDLQSAVESNVLLWPVARHML